ncbi:MAG: tetraacyldisaccharide 4'-kinase [Saprospiraceae bacterium]|nr:tetraacyldisaccharide 4'-kinase [Saprospiraceae bacterium]
MVRSFLIRVLLLPFSLLYGIVVAIRNFLYKNNFLNSIQFSIPVISVGNLTVGGAGKSPHVEYLIQTLDPYLDVTTLSRGYKRKTKGFMEVLPQHTAQIAGDEPVQFKRKFPKIGVYVDESRVFGIPRIITQRPGTQVVILDDAFQHLSVKPGLNILLTEYDRPFTRDWLLPSGRLREWRAAYKRADIIIISKCPFDLTEEERQAMIEEVSPLPDQKIYFSYYEYGAPYDLFSGQRIQLQEDHDVLLVSGIARTDYLMQYLEEKVGDIKVLEFEDHHDYTPLDVSQIEVHFKTMTPGKTIVLTTEKDAIRLQGHRDFLRKKDISVYALPVKVTFHGEDKDLFDQEIKSFLMQFEA